MINDTIKNDTGKPMPLAFPTQIIHDIMEIQSYGRKKYETASEWREIALERWINALLRHTLAFWGDQNSVDDESGLPHYKHMACNLAFICELIEREESRKVTLDFKDCINGMWGGKVD